MKMKPKESEDLVERAHQLDLRRQQQVRNQIATIERLLGGASVTEEVQTLHDQLAGAQLELEDARREILRLKQERST